MLSGRHTALDHPGPDQTLASRHAFPAAEASTGALPNSPPRPASPPRQNPGSTWPGESRAWPEDNPGWPGDNRGWPDDNRGWPDRGAPMPEQSPARPSSGPQANGRMARHAPESSAPWPVAPHPAEARLAPPEQAQRTAGRRGPDPLAGPATSAFDRTDVRGGQRWPGQPGNVASMAAAGMAAAQAASDEELEQRSAPARSIGRRSSATAVDAPPVRPAPAKKRESDDRNVAGRRTARRKRRHPVLLAVLGGGAVGGVAAAGILVSGVFGGTGGPEHVIVTPNKLLSYVQNPALAKGMGAQALRADILAKGNGEASHVVDAVYQDSSGSAAKILLFVGGNLSGSAQGFISSFTGMLPSAFVINPGSLGGQAACVPGTGGHPAECAWADNDTFGLIASPALNASTLAGELRSIRPLVERHAK
jgi:hypothetical protein